MVYPTDLQPISTAPWDERPEELPLDIEEARTALWVSNGNVTKAAELLKVPSRRLRQFVKGSQYLSREIEEARERIVDIAEDNIVEALLDDKDPGRRDSMTRFVAASLGKSRGYSSNAGSGGPTKVSIGNITIEWQTAPDDNPTPGDDAKVIDVDAN